MSTNSLKEKILAANPIENIIGEVVDLKRNGPRRLGCCPFHEEKTPSFYVFDDHYHCFGCGAHGDTIEFVKNHYGLGFIDTLKWLANKGGVDASELDRGRDRGKWQKEKRIRALTQSAHDYFIENLQGPEGKPAKDYLNSRGFDDEQIKKFQFGLALNQPNALVKVLTSQGYKEEEIFQASLCNRSKKGMGFDFFQNRLMVPIFNHHGTLIAFGGRTLGDDPQKYKNSRYDKKLLLYGLSQSRDAIRKQGYAVVVEGYMDTLSLWAHGITNAVACQGTALTKEHLDHLDRCTNKVVLLFDGDAAGRKASLKVVDLALKFSDLQIDVASLPDGQDPDSFVRSEGSESLQKIIDSSDGLLSFAIKSQLEGVEGANIPVLVRKNLLPWVRSQRDPITRSYLCSVISQSSGIRESVLIREVEDPGQSFENPQKKLEKPQASNPEPTEEEKAQNLIFSISDLDKIQRELIGHIYFSEPSMVENLEQPDTFDWCSLPLGWKYFLEEMIACLKKDQSPFEQNADSWCGYQSEEFMKWIETLSHRKELYNVPDKNMVLEKLRKRSQFDHVKMQIATLKEQLYSLESSDSDLTLDILKSIKKLQAQQNSLR